MRNGSCNKFISAKNRRITCDICNKFYHVKCSIKTKDYACLIENNIGWICTHCREEIFPFINITNDEMFDIFNDDANIPSLPKKAKCGSCSRKIKKGFPHSHCNSCNKFFHLSCAERSKKDLTLKSWNCRQCLNLTLPFSSIDQNSFLLTLHGKNDKEIESLNNGPSFSMKSLIDKMPGQRFNTDEFLSDNIESRYYSTGDFLGKKFPSNKFSIIHINIASLQKHIDEFRSFLAGLNIKFDIICISETRLYDEPLVNIEIDGYSFIHTPTQTRCGGVGMYITKNLDFEIIEALSTCHTNICESIFVEIKHPTKKNVIAGTIYRHHTAVNDFVDNFLRQTLQKITKTKKTCVLAGDFNVDLINYGQNCHVDSFYDEISSYSFRPLVLQPSRVTSKSATLIDNIFVNDLSSFSSGGNITCSISDHFSQFCFINIFEKVHSSKKAKFSRDWRNFNRERFDYEIRNLS